MPYKSKVRYQWALISGLVLLQPLSLSCAGASRNPFLVPAAMMRSRTETEDIIQSFLAELLGWQQEFERLSLSINATRRPFVTVSFAQSLDGFMAPFAKNDNSSRYAEIITTTSSNQTTGNYLLSGEDSPLLTHALRSIHDGILIGGTTLSLDNPRLTNRLWNVHSESPTQLSSTVLPSPRPIVLDSSLDRALRLGRRCRLHGPIVCCSDHVTESKIKTAKKLLPVGALILQCRMTPDGKLDIEDVLLRLKLQCGIQSVMVEGGPLVLSSLFGAGLVDAVCVTVAPKVLHSGIAPTFYRYTSSSTDASDASINHAPIDLGALPQRVATLGKDFILLSRFQNFTRG